MRTKFSSISECITVWARQSQDKGESGNVSFSGGVLYSYSLAIANILDGATLIYGGSNSVTTNRHVCLARRAAPGKLLPVAFVETDPYTTSFRHGNNMGEMVNSMVTAADKWARARRLKDYRRSEVLGHAGRFIRYVRLFDLGEMAAVQYPMLMDVIALNDFDALRAWCSEWETVNAVMNRIGGEQ